MTTSIYQEKMSQLYKIEHKPTSLTYYGSCWKEGKSFEDRFQEHLNGNGRGLHKKIN